MDWVRNIPRFSLLLLLLLLRVGQAQETPEARALSVSEYITQLNHFTSAVKQLSKPEQVPGLLKEVPQAWRIDAETRVFEVPAEWLRQDLQDWQRKPDRVQRLGY